MKIQRVGSSIQQNKAQKQQFEGTCKIYESGLSVLLDGRPRFEKSLKMFQRIIEKLTDNNLQVKIGAPRGTGAQIEGTKHHSNILIIFDKNGETQECGFFLNPELSANRNTTNLFQTLKDLAGEHLRWDYIQHVQMKKIGNCDVLSEFEQQPDNPTLPTGMNIFKNMIEKLTNLNATLDKMPEGAGNSVSVSSYEKVRDIKHENLKFTFDNKKVPEKAGFYWNPHITDVNKNANNGFQLLKDIAANNFRWDGLLEKSDLSRKKLPRKGVYNLGDN